MAGSKILRSDLQELLDRFAAFQQGHICLEERNAAQETLVRMQQTELEASRKEAKRQRTRMANILNALASVKKENAELRRARVENEHLAKSFDKLQRDYDHLRTSSNEYAEQMERDSQDRIRRLEEELELGRAQLALEMDEHRENINCLVLKYEGKLQAAEEKASQLAEGKKKKIQSRVPDTVHESGKPVSFDNRWFELEQQFDVAGTPKATVPKKRRVVPKVSKKRKLYNLNPEATIDLG